MSRVVDWLEMHEFRVSEPCDVLDAYKARTISANPFYGTYKSSSVGTTTELSDRLQSFNSIVVPALIAGFDRSANIRRLLALVEFVDLLRDPETLPHTEDLGSGTSPRIAMGWRGQPEDLICLAHEAGHALQILLSGHRAMPPVARETCAFIGELLLLEYARTQTPILYETLRNVWVAENEVYLGRDLEALAQALGAPETPYNYRQNYPIARLAAVELFAQGSGSWLHDLFSAGSGGMCHLPIASMADRASDIANYLPPMPAFDAEQTAMDAYRSLGAMVLLDIEYWKGEPEKRIEDYYSGLLHHLRARTAYGHLE